MQAWSPAPVSPKVGPGFSGGPSGMPVRLMIPLAAWAIGSKARYLA